MAVISLSFLFFVFMVCLGYFILPMKTRPYWLLTASLFFYACFDLRYFIFLGMSVATTYIAARYVASLDESKNRLKKAVLAITIICNIGFLVFVKYFNYSLSIIGSIAGVEMPQYSLIVPLGVAFYSLQAVSYLVDVYKGKYEPEKNFLKYMLYMTYFPIIMQGPISRYNQLAQTLFVPHSFSWDRMKSGISLMIWGAFKKMVIADRAAIFVNQVFNNYVDYEGVVVVVAILLYTIQLYTDFSGCVDISRGVSEVLGIEIINNFNHPYFATSIKDFWRRWHISLSSWFRDYIYIPLGGSRVGTVRKYLNVMIVFFVSGLWHGVGLNFIIWGFLHGAYQVVGALTSSIREKVYEKWSVNREVFSYKFLQQIFTFGLVSFAWLFFRASGAGAAVHMMRSAIKGFKLWSFTDGSLLQLGLDGLDWNVLILAIVVLWIVSFLQERGSVRALINKQNLWLRWGIYLLSIWSVLVFGIYGPGYDSSQFIYMQF